MPQFLVHTMKSPLPSSARAGGPPGTRPWGIPAVHQHHWAEQLVQQPAPSTLPRGQPRSIAVTKGNNHLPLPTLFRGLQRRSFAIASLQRKLDAQRAEHLTLQANYKQLRLTLITLLDLWNELRSEHLPESEKPLPASEKEQTIQSPNCNASQPSVQCEFAIQSCTASATPSNVHPERTAPIDDVQSSPSPTSPSKLIPGHLPPTQSINSPPLPPAWPPQQSAPPPAMPEPLLTEALNIDPNVSNGAPNLEQLQLSAEGHHPTHLAESVPATTLPAAQQQRPFTFSAKVQPSKKMAPCKTKRGTQQVTLKSDNLNSWFQGIPDLPPQPLRHGPIWETPQGTTMHHTCAPPPGWKVVNGITVQPPPNPTIDQQIVSSFEERDDNLGVWFYP